MADAVQTFRAISWLIFKWLLISAAVLIAIYALGVGTYLAYRWYTYDRHAALIEPVIRIDEKTCDRGDYPLFVGFVNRSSRVLDKVSFAVQARIAGRSSNIANFEIYSSDTIIKPGEGSGTCWRVPKLSELVLNLSSLNWSVGYLTYTFAE